MQADKRGMNMIGWTAGSGIFAAVMLLLSTLPVRAAQPSFDCEGARAEVEKLICGDDVLADLDQRLARDFARALARASADKVSELRSAQRNWRAKMLKCSQSADPRSCTLDAYTARVGEF